MIETLNIFFHVIFLFILNLLPKKIYFLKFQYKENIQIFSNIIIISILLLFSFLNLKIFFVVNFIYFVVCLNLFFLLKDKEIKFFFDENNLVLFFVIVILSIYLSVNLKLGWDAQNYWILRYLNFKNELGIENISNLTRPDYPFLGSYIWAIFSETSFLNFEYLGRIYFIYIFCIALKKLVDLTELNFNEKNLIFFFLIVILFNKNLINGYQEILVFSFLVFLSFYTYLLIKNKFDLNIFIISILTINLLFWLKNEAMIFALILSFISMFFLSPKKKVIVIISIFFLIIARYLFYNYFNLDINLQSGNYDKLDARLILDLIDFKRLYLIFKFLIFAHFKNLLSFISLFVIFLIFISKIKIDKTYKFLIFITIANYLFIFSAYFFSTFPLEFHLKTSSDRLLFQSLGSYLILSFIFLKDFLKKNEN